MLLKCREGLMLEVYSPISTAETTTQIPLHVAHSNVFCSMTFNSAHAQKPPLVITETVRHKLEKRRLR